MSDDRILWCGNLSEKVNEDILYELFLQAGPLENVHIPKDKDGKPKRFAFVTFKHAISVPYTVALMNGICLFDRPLALNPKTGAKTEHNPFLEKLHQYQNHMESQGQIPYNSSQRDHPYEDNVRRGYDSRRYDTRSEPPRWNQFSGPSFPQYNMNAPSAYGFSTTNHGKYGVNSMSHTGYPQFGVPWNRNRC